MQHRKRFVNRRNSGANLKNGEQMVDLRATNSDHLTGPAFSTWSWNVRPLSRRALPNDVLDIGLRHGRQLPYLH